MASTYTTGFGIEKIGTGEQSGTWGTTTNHNADILDRIASYKAVALSGTTHTLTIREASPGSGTENLQDGMYRVIKFTGALGGNNTVTIAPNTSPAWFIIENATTDSGSSGPYTVILTQGSGANVTVQNGKNAIVYCDGAGSGAVVYDALADLQVGSLEVTGAAAIDGVTTHGGNVVSDTDSTDDLGTTGVRWANLFVDAITTTGEITAAGFTGTLDGILGGGTPAAATVTTIDASGVATATTFEPDGDTSASDNAAIGYTSAEGLILTGQGSTNDVTIKNDADADVITIATGATNVDVVGDLTASTLNADGDTAASDNAAIGYTSAEGIIITGQGSTNDVTIKNDADADVLEIPTGTTNVTVVGNITAGGNLISTGTVEPAGDTAAGDNAAMGYTSAEGLILTGQGSTNAVTIKNDADADVITIPTGATGVVLAGALTLGGAVAGADNQIGRVNLIDYGEVTNAIGGTGGGTQDIDLTAGNSVSATVDTNTNTFTFSNPTASDELCGFTLTLVNGGSQTVNWPSSVDWASATAPTLTSSGTDILVFFTIDGGTIWHGMIASADSS